MSKKRRPLKPRHKRNPIAHYNSVHDEVPYDGTTQSIKNEFARRLQAACDVKGWGQSELARRATGYLPTPAEGQKQGHRIGRDQISHYICGVSLPRSETLRALARALGVEPRTLLPGGVPSTSAPSPFHMRTIDENRTQVYVNRVMSFKNALRIAAIIEEEKK